MDFYNVLVHKKLIALVKYKKKYHRIDKLQKKYVYSPNKSPENDLFLVVLFANIWQPSSSHDFIKWQPWRWCTCTAAKTCTHTNAHPHTAHTCSNSRARLWCSFREITLRYLIIASPLLASRVSALTHSHHRHNNNNNNIHEYTEICFICWCMTPDTRFALFRIINVFLGDDLASVFISLHHLLPLAFLLRSWPCGGAPDSDTSDTIWWWWTGFNEYFSIHIRDHGWVRMRNEMSQSCTFRFLILGL